MLTLLLGTMDRIAILRIVGRRAGAIRQGGRRTRSRGPVSHANVDHRVVTEVLVATDDGITLIVLEADAWAGCGGGIQAVEVLDSGYDGLSGVMRVDLDPHGYPRTVLVRVLDQLELDGAGDGRLCVLRLRELHDAGVSAHGGEDMCLGRGRGSVVLERVRDGGGTGLCSGGDVRCGRLCRHQTQWCHS